MRPALRILRRPNTKVHIPITGQWSPIRSIAGSSKRDDQGQEQVHALRGYYADMLDAPLHSVQNATRTAHEPPPTDDLPMTEKEKTLAKARVVFGSRMSGPEERQKQLESESQWIAGVMVPPRPEEPDNCCMSGCVNCVWERYREELEEYVAKSNEARQKMIAQRTSGQATGMMAAESGMPSHTAVSMDDDGGGSETNWATMPEPDALQVSEETPDPLAGIPVGIREFMKTEKKLKQRHREAGDVLDTALDKELRASVWGAGT